MSETKRLGLPLLAQSQAQKHITHNQSLFMIDMLAQTSVKSATLTSPPSTLEKGDCFLVAGDATSDWTGKEKQLAYWTGQAWLFAEPKEGWSVWDQATNQLLLHNGTAWIANGYVPSNLGNRSQLGIQADPDDTNRLSVKSNAALFSHDDVTPGSGDIQVKVNKKEESASATFLFQSNWQGHAEIGLAGDEHFSFKTSPDGSVWKAALRLNKDTGLAELPAGGKASAPFQLASYQLANVPDASDWPAGLIFISNAPGGARPAFSDGTIWRWTHDLTAIA